MDLFRKKNSRRKVIFLSSCCFENVIFIKFHHPHPVLWDLHFCIHYRSSSAIFILTWIIHLRIICRFVPCNMNLSQADIRNPDPEYALTIFTLPGIFCAAFTVTDITIQNSIKKHLSKSLRTFSSS